MPAMGESVSEGTVLEWAKAVGDAIEADETIVEISTDKVDAEVPAPASGTVAELLVEPGATVEVGQVLGRIAAGAGAPRATDPAPEPTSAPRPAGDAPADAASVDGDAQRHAGRPPRGRRPRHRPHQRPRQRPVRPDRQGGRARRRRR